MVFLGAGLGGTLRQGVSIACLRLFGSGFPFGTLTVNILGSIIMGVLTGLFATRIEASQGLRLFLTTGMLGGFTTFSTFSLDTVTLFERGEVGTAIGYAVGSLAAGIAGLFIALLVLRRFA